jgi:hypothetical protein
MKKLIALLVMVMSLGFSSLGFCSSASDLLAKEEQVVETLVKVMGSEAELSTLQPYMTDGLQKNFRAAQVQKAQKGVSDNFGKMSNLRLLRLDKQKDADILIYVADAKKVPNVRIEVIFETKGKKAMLNSFGMSPIDLQKIEQQIQQQAAAAQKKQAAAQK